ncbi:DUF4859 domain-containing protein [Robertkochia solimangrovi]|nr:DUF4859 domain-containing protein [Robertkochia solimangrovi]
MVFLTFGCKSDNFVPVTEATNNGNDEEQSEEVADTVTILDPETIDASKIYVPEEFGTMDLYKSSSQWYYGRSKQSEHFIVFWDTEYGEMEPGEADVPEAYRVDIDDLLEKAEAFYTMNIEVLKFAETGVGKSKLDDYKMMIFIYYQDEWLATGSGYDNMIGALWVSPNTCQPVGSTIAHEIGHSFQYQVYADLGGTTGYRYGFGGNGGNAFWEQTAQWQSFQSYPEQIFTSYDFPVYIENYQRHIHHEMYRYASYFIHYYWADKHGIDIIGKLWRNAEEPEDPIQTYMRLTGISIAEFNDEIYDAASKFVTWDLDALRTYGADYVGDQIFKNTTLEDGSYMVSYESCPGTTGYNVIPLNVPEAETVISTEFTGVPNAEGFNTVANPGRAGWRYGYVALKTDGTRVYGDMHEGLNETVEFKVPEGCDKLWFVVTGAPNTYKSHPWDDDESNDDQWPYKVKFENTDLLGNLNFDENATPEDTSITFDISFPFSEESYNGTTVTLSGNTLSQLAQAFVIQPSEITAAMDDTITFYAVESDGNLNEETTANGYGHWFDANGDVTSWGSDAVLFSEFSASSFSFTIGQYPGQTEKDTTYTFKQALVYEYESGNTVTATFVFNVTIE